MEEVDRWHPVMKQGDVYLVENPKGKKGSIQYSEGQVSIKGKAANKDIIGKLLEFGTHEILINGLTGDKGFVATEVYKNENKLDLEQAGRLVRKIGLSFINYRRLQPNMVLLKQSMENESNVNEGKWNDALVYGKDGLDPQATLSVNRPKPKPIVYTREIELSVPALLKVLKELTGEDYIQKEKEDGRAQRRGEKEEEEQTKTKTKSEVEVEVTETVVAALNSEATFKVEEDVIIPLDSLGTLDAKIGKAEPLPFDIVSDIEQKAEQKEEQLNLFDFEE